MKSGSGETGSKSMLFNAHVIVMNILSVVNTKQCLLSYIQGTFILAVTA